MDVEDGDQDLQDPPEEAAGGGLSGPKDLLQKLRAMQQKKPVMDVVCSVLQDDQIRNLASPKLLAAKGTADLKYISIEQSVAFFHCAARVFG